MILQANKRLDPQRVLQTVQTLLRQHDMLRATFVRKEAGVQQTILHPDDVQLDLRTYDLSGIDHEEQMQECKRIEGELKHSIQFS